MKKIVKTLIVMIVMVLFLPLNGYSSLIERETFYKSYKEFEEDFYRKAIPEQYSEAFLYYTRNFPQIRKDFYSLMVVESCNFTCFKAKNKDGTWDYGPSQLNSSNIKNKNFRKWYNPKDESKITNKYCFYMVMTINFYWDLINKHGKEYAFYAYNGGERVVSMIKNDIKDSRYVSLLSNVRAYDNRVRKEIVKTNKKIFEFILEEQEKYAKSQENQKIPEFLVNYTVSDTRIRCEKFISFDEFLTNNILYYDRRKYFLELKGEELIGYYLKINFFNV